MKSYQGKTFDRIFMSDVFLYYYEPYKEMDLNGDLLLAELAKLLAPGGIISIMDPHGCFHLQPWLGQNHPYLVATEYRHRNFRVLLTLKRFPAVQRMLVYASAKYENCIIEKKKHPRLRLKQ